MFLGLMAVLIIILVVGFIVIGQVRMDQWFNDKFRCPHEYTIRKNYLEPETEIAVCQKCGRKEIIEDGE